MVYKTGPKEGELGHDEVEAWCLDCDTYTIHAVRILRCSTEQRTCKRCGKEN